MYSQASQQPSSHSEKMPNREKKLGISVFIVIAFVTVMAVMTIVLGAQALSRRGDISTTSIADNGRAVLANGNFDQMSGLADQDTVKKMIRKIYTTSYSSSVRKNLERLKKKTAYEQSAGGAQPLRNQYHVAVRLFQDG